MRGHGSQKKKSLRLYPSIKAPTPKSNHSAAYYYNLHNDDEPILAPLVQTTLRQMKTTTADDLFHEGIRLYQEWFDQWHSNNNNYDTSTVVVADADLQKVVSLFQNAIVELEEEAATTTPNANNNSNNNLLVALRALATVYATLDDPVKCLQMIDEIPYWKSCKMPFPIEKDDEDDNNKSNNDKDSTSSWEWVYCHDDHSSGCCKDKDKDKAVVALRTTGQRPWLNASAIETIQKAANNYRLLYNDSSRSTNTRFTMQYDGNSDLHVADLLMAHHYQPAMLQDIFHELLQSHVYPLVRKAFLSSSLSSSSLSLQPLCVYDALIVRYDANIAKRHGRTKGASLPLHRDGGLFSVNIALQQQQQQQQQQQENNATNGTGGGTLFDRLLLLPRHNNTTSNNHNNNQTMMMQEIIQNATIRPLGPGYAVVHRSTERHAGAPTTTTTTTQPNSESESEERGAGIREILVFFLTLRPTTNNNRCDANENDDHHSYEYGRGVERSFYLKELAQKHQQLLPIGDTTIQRLYEWAIKENPRDGDALFWVAHSQIQRAKLVFESATTTTGTTTNLSYNRNAIWKDFQSGIESLETVVKELDPCNVRTLAFLASAYCSRWGFALDTHQQAFGLNEKVELEKAASVLRRAIYLANIYDVVFGTDDDDDNNNNNNNNALLGGKATLLLQLGEILLLQGQNQSALDCLREVPNATKYLPEPLKSELRTVAKEMLVEIA